MTAGVSSGPNAASCPALVAALDQAAGGDHLAHVQPGAVAAAQRAERGVGDARHRRQHHRRRHLERTDPQRRHVAALDRRGAALGTDAAVAVTHPGWLAVAATVQREVAAAPRSRESGGRCPLGQCGPVGVAEPGVTGHDRVSFEP